MNYQIAYPRSGSTATRYIIELLTKRPTNGLIGAKNLKDNLQMPLIYKDRDDFILHKRHDFRGVMDKDFILFIIRDPLEAIIRHNEHIRGIAEHQMVAYIASWFSLLREYDEHKGDKMLFYYDELMKIADKTSLGMYRNPQSNGPHFHRAKLGKYLSEKLEKHMEEEYSELYQKYLR